MPYFLLLNCGCFVSPLRRYGTGLGLIPTEGPLSVLSMPNTVYGIVYYVIHILLQQRAIFGSVAVRNLAVLLGVASIATCVWLAYILYFVLQVYIHVCMFVGVHAGAWVCFLWTYFHVFPVFLAYCLFCFVGKHENVCVHAYMYVCMPVWSLIYCTLFRQIHPHMCAYISRV